MTLPNTPRRYARLLWTRTVYWLSLSFWVGALAQQLPQDSRSLQDRVLVIHNVNSLTSTSVAQDYIERRHITHTLAITCRDSAIDHEAETIGFQEFQRAIASQVEAYLAKHSEIDFIVLTKGVPIRIADAPQGRAPGRLALDSYLASADYAQLSDAVRVDVTDLNYGVDFHGLAWANRFWNSQRRFSHRVFGGYLVTRLDGYNGEEAKALTTRALDAERLLRPRSRNSNPILLDVCPAFGFDEQAKSPHSILPETPGLLSKIIRESPFGEFNSDLRWAANLLTARTLPVELDLSDRFVGQRTGLGGYVSWGSNDAKYDEAAYRSLTFSPGALCETAVSTSARTFLQTQGGQSLIADLIRQGATGVKGYSDEPLLQAVASPSILFERYTKGWTLAESYYAASRLVGWQDVVVGDPLGRAYSESPP